MTFFQKSSFVAKCHTQTLSYGQKLTVLAGCLASHCHCGGSNPWCVGSDVILNYNKTFEVSVIGADDPIVQIWVSFKYNKKISCCHFSFCFFNWKSFINFLTFRWFVITLLFWFFSINKVHKRDILFYSLVYCNCCFILQQIIYNFIITVCEKTQNVNYVLLCLRPKPLILLMLPNYQLLIKITWLDYKSSSYI